MDFVIEVAKGSTTLELPPLPAVEALRRLEDAEAHGLFASCTDAEGRPASKEHLRRAAGQDGGTDRNDG